MFHFCSEQNNSIPNSVDIQCYQSPRTEKFLDTRYLLWRQAGIASALVTGQAACSDVTGQSATSHTFRYEVFTGRFDDRAVAQNAKPVLNKD